MTKKPAPEQKAGKAKDRATALRANLAKRKGQANARRAGKAIGKSEEDAFSDPEVSLKPIKPG